MAKLSNAELSKFREGRYRWESFLSHYLNKKPFECSPAGKEKFGNLVKLEVEQNLVQDIQAALNSENFSHLNRIRFKTESGTEVRLSDLEKTEEFGRSGGVSGGSEQTAVVEAAQCIVCGALSENNSIESEKVPNGSYSVPNNQLVWNQYKNLKSDWHEATEQTANALISYLGSGWVYHYGDSLVQAILEKFNALKKGHFSGRKDKWNPADIWVSKGDIHLGDFNSFEDFSKFCFSENLKGISLKKGGTTVKEYPIRNAEFAVENAVIHSRPSKTNTSIEIWFNFKGADAVKTLTVRPDRASLKCEIKTKGNTHRNGSCGQKFLFQVLSDLGFKGETSLISKIKQVEKLRQQDMLNHPGDYSEDQLRGAELEGSSYSLNEVPEEIVGLSPDQLEKYAAKQMLSEIAQFLEESNQLNQFASQISRYCVSSLPNSCTYLKVS